MQIKSLLCICTGNICRSPLAEGLFHRDVPTLRVASAGIGAVVGGAMPEAAAAIAVREGLQLDTHKGQQVDGDILSAHDLVLVMETGQKNWLVSRFPESRGRVFLLTHWNGGEDIVDPYRLDAGVFESVFAHIQAGADAWRLRLAPKGIGAHDNS